MICNQKTLLATSLVFLACSAHAEWTGSGTIGDFNIHSDAGGDAVRVTHDIMKNPAGCANGTFLELRASAPAFQEMFSLLLAAKTADRKVDINLSDTTCTTAGHPMITQVSYNQVAGTGLANTLPTATPTVDGLMSAQDKAKLDSLPNGPLTTGSNVAILTGTVADGGTIPLPSGYEESQCKWNITYQSLPYTACNGLSFDKSLAGRVVTAKKHYAAGRNCTSAGISVDYMIVCAK